MEFRALLLGLTLSFAVISCNNDGSTVTPAKEGSSSTTTNEPTLKTPQTTTNTTSETTTPKPSSTTSKTKDSNSSTTIKPTLNTAQTTTNTISETTTTKSSSKLSTTRIHFTLSPQRKIQRVKTYIEFLQRRNFSANLTEVLKGAGYVKKKNVSASIKATPNTPLNNHTTKPDSTTSSDKSSPSMLSTSTPAQNSSTPTEKTTKIPTTEKTTKKTTTEKTTKKPPLISEGKSPGYSSPRSSHFAVVFLVMIALLFGLYALYHNRQKIIAVVVEGRSSSGGRGNRERYRKLDSGVEEPRARIKKSNEVYVY